MSKQIKITPTDGLHAAIAAYAKEHNISNLAKASAILVAQALNYTETPVRQHGGNRTQLMQCGWCGHQQNVFSWQDECRKCGECEFLNIENNNQ